MAARVVYAGRAPPPALCCGVCARVFRDPVLAVGCGHTFCASGIAGPPDMQPASFIRILIN
jgi:hypothetical protein